MRPRTLRSALARATKTTLTAIGAALLLIGLGPAGCSEEDGGTPTFPVVGEDIALVRFAHLSPDAGTVDVIVNEGQSGSFRVDDVDFGVISRFFEIPATFDGATVDVTVRTSGGAEAIDETIEVLRGSVQTVAVIGRATPTQPEDADALRAVVLPTTIDARAAEATVSFVHAAPAVPPVIVTEQGIPVPPLFGETAFGEKAPTVLRLAPEGYDLQIRPAETGDVALSFPDVTVENGVIYTLWAVENPSGAVEAIVSIDTVDDASPTTTTVTLSPAAAALRAAHYSFKAPAVQVLVDGTIVSGLENVSYPAISGDVELTAATHRVQVFEASVDPSGEGVEPLVDTVLTLEAGTSTTVAAIAQGGVNGVLLPEVFVYRGQTPSAGNAIVRFLHASDYVQTLRLVVVDGENEYATTTSPVTGPITPFVEVPAGTHDLSVRAPNINDFQVFLRSEVTLDAGGVYNVYFVGDPAPPIPAGAEPDLIVDPQPALD